MIATVREDQAIVQRPLEEHRYLALRLQDLERPLDGHDPRYTGDVAVLEGIGRGPGGCELGPLRRRVGQIGDGATDHEASLEAPVGVALHLPEALEVGMAVSRPRE